MLVVALLILGQTIPHDNQAWVQGARALVGIRYQFGGRARSGEGIDCLGVVLAGAEKATGCGWKSFPVNPTELAKQQLFGKALPGFPPLFSSVLDVSGLRPGDVVFLLAAAENSLEPALTSLNGVSLWVWHTGIYSGENRWIVGDHFAEKAVETNFTEYLQEHGDTYSAVYILRPESKRPKVCLRHRPITPLAGPATPLSHL